MLRKIICYLLLVTCALLLIGCGGKKDDVKKDEPAQKTEEAAKIPEGSPDKAVLAYAQLYAYGIIEDENMAAAGMTEKDIEAVQDKVLSPISDAFQKYTLSEERVAEKTGCYVEKLQKTMNLKATGKKDDPNNP